MNRSQRRRAAHQAKAKKANATTKELSVRARFERDVRTALLLKDIKLVSMNPGQEQERDTGQPTGEAFWVMTVYAEDRFLTVKSSRGTIAAISAGVAQAVKDALARAAQPTPEPAPVVTMAEVDAAIRSATPIEEDLSLAERIRRAQKAAP